MPDHEQLDAANPRRWRTSHVSTDTLPGRPADDVAQLHRADGFEVQIVDLDVSPDVDAAFQGGRVRLATRNGLVIQAFQG